MFLLAASGAIASDSLKTKQNMKKGKVTGIGGVFFKGSDTKMLKDWYSKNLQFECDEYGHLFEWFQPQDPTKKGTTQWSIFDARTKYFQPSEKDYMINYRVENLAELIIQLKESGINIIGGVEEFEYGKFAWIMDPEGNKIELWEPVDAPFFKDKK